MGGSPDRFLTPGDSWPGVTFCSCQITKCRCTINCIKWRLGLLFTDLTWRARRHKSVHIKIQHNITQYQTKKVGLQCLSIILKRTSKHTGGKGLDFCDVVRRSGSCTLKRLHELMAFPCYFLRTVSRRSLAQNCSNAAFDSSSELCC